VDKAAGRDVGLRRVSRITRWSLGSAVVLTGALSVLVAHAKPGHKVSSISTTPTTPADPNSGDTSLQPPTTGAPSFGGGGGLVNSGAS
jgi:hypothetical protein